MKRWHSIVLAGLLVCAAVLLYRYRQELGLTGVTSNVFSPARATHVVWKPVDRSADGFTVEMPADVKEMQIPAYNESGSADPVNTIYADPDADTHFSVAWADNPPVIRVNGRSPDRTLDMARDQELARTQTSLISESKSTQSGFPARDIVAQNSNGGVIDSRLIFVGQRLYVLIAAFPSMGARREQDVHRFYDSFHTQDAASLPKPLRSAEAGDQHDSGR